jgi:hypothetical protein
MKKLIFLLLISNFLFAQSGFKISAGPNISTFINEKDSETYMGYALGLQYEYCFANNFSVNSGLMFSKEGSLLKDKITKPSVLSEGANVADVFIEDIYAVIGYLKMPILFGYSFKVFNDNVSKLIICGSLMYAIKDFSYSNNLRFAFLYRVGETEYDFEYLSTGAESFFFKNHFNYSIDIGFSQNYRKLFLELTVNYHLDEFGYVEYISEIKKNLLSGKCAIGYQL